MYVLATLIPTYNRTAHALTGLQLGKCSGSVPPFTARQKLNHNRVTMNRPVTGRYSMNQDVRLPIRVFRSKSACGMMSTTYCRLTNCKYV